MNTSADMQEAFRLTELLQLSILDTPPEPEYDALVQLATTLFGCAISTVTLVDNTRQWFKAKAGINVSETPKNISICQHTIQSNRPLLINDAQCDPRVSNSPLVQGAPYLRSYLGVPIQSINKARIGTFCVMDTAPRIWSEREVQLAAQLATMAEMLIQKHEPARNRLSYLQQHSAGQALPSELRGAWDWVPGQPNVRVSASLRRTFDLPLNTPVHAGVFSSLGIERSWMNASPQLKKGLHSRVQYEHRRLDGSNVTLQEEIHVVETSRGVRVCGLIHALNAPTEADPSAMPFFDKASDQKHPDIQSAIECLQHGDGGYLVVDENQWINGHCEQPWDNHPRPLLPVRLEDCFDTADFGKVLNEWVAAKMGLRTQSVFVRNLARNAPGSWLKIKPLPRIKGHTRSGHLLIRYTSLQERSR